MKKGKKSFLSLLLSLFFVLTTIFGVQTSTTVEAANTENSAASIAETQSRSVQDGVTLHCWNWSYANIEANMEKIAELGYTAVQTSPIQQAKESTTGKKVGEHWWVYYQPGNFVIDNTGYSALGTKAEFESMCETAHSYGIKVIVDVVANHMGNRTSNNLADTIPDDLKYDSSCWHDISKNTETYNYRYDITQYCMNGVPDLNTGNPKVQNYIINLLKECVDAGADGFRFDAAKHIETPEDSTYGCGSNFWPNVMNSIKSYASSTRGIDLYCYGEILDKTAGIDNLSLSAYTQYMSITDNERGDDLLKQVNEGQAASAGSSYYKKETSADNLVMWAESHDTFASNKSSGVSVTNVNKTWALVAARADVMGLYLARPYNMSSMLGAADITGWSYDEVGAVNAFHNTFVGEKEYVANEGSIAYCERGTAGVVLVNCGGTYANINVTAHTIADGTYYDQITGNEFKVSGGRITGNMGGTGIAVVYNPSEPVVIPEIEVSQNGGNFSSESITVTATVKNATAASYRIGNGKENTFNGKASITLGADMNVGESITLTVTASNENETVVKEYTFTKVEKSENVAYIDLPDGWNNTVYCYAYDSATETVSNGEWPGVEMTDIGDGVYCYEVPESIENPRVIFYSSDNCRYPGDMEPGLLVEGSMIYKDGSWSSYEAAAYGTVTVSYIDEAGNEVATSVVLEGKVGESYTTTAANVSGYTLKETDGATTGTFAEGNISVTYIYEVQEDGVADVAYIEKPDSWGSNLYCYVYSESDESNTNGAWPGVAMTHVSGDVYEYEVPANIADPLVIFTDGSNQYPASMQKGLDLEGKMIYKDGVWETYSGIDFPENVAYIAKDASWGNTMYCYVYSESNESNTNGAWPGVAMTQVSGNIYKYEVPENITDPLVIFTDGINQYPGSMEKGLDLSGSMIYENGRWSTY